MEGFAGLKQGLMQILILLMSQCFVSSFVAAGSVRKFGSFPPFGSSVGADSPPFSFGSFPPFGSSFPPFQGFPSFAPPLPGFPFTFVSGQFLCDRCLEHKLTANVVSVPNVAAELECTDKQNNVYYKTSGISDKNGVFKMVLPTHIAASKDKLSKCSVSVSKAVKGCNTTGTKESKMLLHSIASVSATEEQHELKLSPFAFKPLQQFPFCKNAAVLADNKDTFLTPFPFGSSPSATFDSPPSSFPLGSAPPNPNTAFQFPPNSPSFFPPNAPSFNQPGFNQPSFSQPGSPSLNQPSFFPPNAPSFNQPGFNQPSFAQPVSPSLNQPSFFPPNAPSFNQPGFNQPSFAQPGSPSLNQPSFFPPNSPSFNQPSVAQPGFPSFNQPASVSPSFAQPGSPALNQPSFPQPGSQSFNQPSFPQPSFNQPSLPQPAKSNHA